MSCVIFLNICATTHYHFSAVHWKATKRKLCPIKMKRTAYAGIIPLATKCKSLLQWKIDFGLVFSWSTAATERRHRKQRSHHVNMNNSKTKKNILALAVCILFVTLFILSPSLVAHRRERIFQSYHDRIAARVSECGNGMTGDVLDEEEDTRRYSTEKRQWN